MAIRILINTNKKLRILCARSCQTLPPLVHNIHKVKATTPLSFKEVMLHNWVNLSAFVRRGTHVQAS